MNSALLNKREYRKLLDVTLPVAIRTEDEHRRLLDAAAALMEKPEDEITQEKGRLLELLGILTEEYEDSGASASKSKTPHKDARVSARREEYDAERPCGLALPKSRVSEILNVNAASVRAGEEARRAFDVPVELFV